MRRTSGDTISVANITTRRRPTNSRLYDHERRCDRLVRDGGLALVVAAARTPTELLYVRRPVKTERHLFD